MPRWLVLSLTNLVLWFILGQVNHYLAPFAVCLYASALFITFAALRLSYQPGLVAAIITGLLVDAVEPVPFGLHLALFTVAHTIIFNARQRFPREETIFAIVVAL